jgi:hypothetical protein
MKIYIYLGMREGENVSTKTSKKEKKGTSTRVMPACLARLIDSASLVLMPYPPRQASIIAN